VNTSTPREWQVIAAEAIILYDGPDQIDAVDAYNRDYAHAVSLGGRIDLYFDGMLVASSDLVSDQDAVIRLFLMHDARTRVCHP